MILAAIVIIIVAAVSYCSSPVMVDDSCRLVAERVGYPEAEVRESARSGFCEILIGTDEDGNEVWAQAKR
jgi:regulator of protease activity HflC (stomatin/prohibitin superfamily)